MKTILRRLLPFLSAAWLWAASAAPAAEPAATIAERGPHHRIWHWTTPEDWPGGARLARQHRVVELATCMHYWAGDRWAESQELIEPFPDGAVARHGPHRAIFAPNLNTREAIDLEMPDGQRLRSHILGLAYTDSASAKNVLIAEIKDCVGEILPPNAKLTDDEERTDDVRFGTCG